MRKHRVNAFIVHFPGNIECTTFKKLPRKFKKYKPYYITIIDGIKHYIVYLMNPIKLKKIKL